MSADDLLAQLYDIRGLDSISWWPLAPGWWVLLILGAAAAITVYRRRLAYARSWKGDAWRNFVALDKRLRGGNAQDVAAELSALIRRVAIRSYSRAECAGLQGKDWLRWLTTKDPGGFDWASNGALLIEAPYAPPGRDVPAESLRLLIRAAKKWV